ncbi:hypothetical protein D3C71_1587280 [compost metagenome]
MRLRTVFNDLEAVPGGERHDRIHVAGPPTEVHADHSLSPRCYHALDGLCRQIAALDIDVREHRRCPSIHDARDAGDESARRDDHFVTRADVHAFEN